MEELFQRAKRVIPGGVNSPVRAYGNVSVSPRFMEKADAGHIRDIDGNEYIDYIGSWGPMILGHNHPEIREAVIKAVEKGLSFGTATKLEVEIAEFLCATVQGLEMIRMVNSGTEAVMSAIRTARGFTKKNKIIKFEGNYHGHSDALLVKAGSGVMTAGIPDSAGVPKGATEDTLGAIYNDLTSVEKLFSDYPNQIAAVIVEPVAANMGVVPPKEGFLEGLRTLCDRNNALLIFDEVITGFRLGYQGAAGYYSVLPDLRTYGKIIGAGMPVGAYGGRKDIMSMVAPVGTVYQAGTLSGNPIAMTAGFTLLKLLYEHPEYYQELSGKSELLFSGIKQVVKENGNCYTINHVESLGCLYFTPNTVKKYEDAKKSNTSLFSTYFEKMLLQGIHIAPSQFEAMFVSYAHTLADIEQTLEAVRESIAIH